MFAAPNSFLTGGVPSFKFSITSDTANLDLRTAALAAGWNGTSKPVCTINSGVLVYSNSTGSYALTISGSFPAGVELINNGTILGKGGAGGNGATPGSCNGCFSLSSTAGTSGGGGGPALFVSTNVKINNVNRIAGGGGGGGGGGIWGGGFAADGGGGGGGTGTGAGGSKGGCSNSNRVSTNGSAGTNTDGGAGGVGGIRVNPGGCKPGTYAQGGDGGAGGGYGSSGGSSGYSGGTGGAAVVGDSFITWLDFGTRNGSIS